MLRAVSKDGYAGRLGAGRDGKSVVWRAGWRSGTCVCCGWHWWFATVLNDLVPLSKLMAELIVQLTPLNWKKARPLLCIQFQFP